MVKVLKIICLSFLMGLILTGTGFAGEHEENFDYDGVYIGKIMMSDKNFILVNIADTEKYCGIRILDKDGFIVDRDIVQGQLLRSIGSIIISDITQESKLVGKVVSRSDSWEEGNRWWRLRYDLRYPN